MVIDGGTINQSHQSPTSNSTPRLWRQKTCPVSLGLDDGSITVANTITDEIIDEYDTKHAMA